MNNFKKWDKKNKVDITRWVLFSLIIIIVTIVFSIIISVIISSVAPFGIKVAQDNNWIGYFGNIIGALIGGLVTFYGLYITIRYEREKEEDNRRLQVIPYLKYSYIDYSEVKDKDQFQNSMWINISPKCNDIKLLDCNSGAKGYVIIENIGLCSAVEVNVLEILYDGIHQYGLHEINTIEVGKNGVLDLTITPPPKGELEKDNTQRRDIKIIVGYSDLLGNYYEQTIELILSWVIQTITDNSSITHTYIFGCGVNNVTRPIVYKDKDIKYEKFKRIDEFFNKNKTAN